MVNTVTGEPAIRTGQTRSKRRGGAIVGADEEDGTEEFRRDARRRGHTVPAEPMPQQRTASSRTRRLIENERLKLRANHLNGIATGLAAGAILTPILTVARYAGSLTSRIISGRAPTFDEVAAVVGAIAAFAMSLQGMRCMRRSADRILEELRDPDD